MTCDALKLKMAGKCWIDSLFTEVTGLLVSLSSAENLCCLLLARGLTWLNDIDVLAGAKSSI